MEIVAICDKLAHAGRQVSDDSALNRLLTLVDSSEPLKIALGENSTRLLAIADKVMAIGDELPDKNVGRGITTVPILFNTERVHFSKFNVLYNCLFVFCYSNSTPQYLRSLDFISTYLIKQRDRIGR